MDHTTHGRAVRDVHVEVVGDSALVADALRHRFARLVIDVGENEAGTLTGEASGSGSADAGGSAGDQGTAPGELAVQLGPRWQRSLSNSM
jgi:hypothetical protein